MIASVYNITVTQGTSFSLPVAITDSSGGAINLTGYTAKAQIRYGAQLAATFTVSGSLGSSGQFSLILTPAQTAQVPGLPCVWDCLLEYGTDVFQILHGRVDVVPIITQP